ncbi:MAG TPA: isoprenylcysteine carboxylmethyltransferase family protein [Anaerolineales bacterium]
MTAQTKLMTPRTIVQLVLVLVVMPLLPIIISGAWGWWEAWAYAALGFLGFVISRVLASRHHPDLLAERSGSMGREDAKPWDRVLAPAMALGSVVPLIVAGLDKLNGWTLPFDLNIKIASLVVIVIGYVIGSWALIENRFFSGVVRIQTDRGHHVVTTGPYRFVRHPGYASAVWTYLATPILLDSLWALISTLLLIGVLILRTSLEDRTLQAELPGYREFTQKTRYRLFPGIW